MKRKLQILVVFSLLHTAISHCNYTEKDKSGLFYPRLALGEDEAGGVTLVALIRFAGSFPLSLPLYFKQTFSNKASLPRISI